MQPALSRSRIILIYKEFWFNINEKDYKWLLWLGSFHENSPLAPTAGCSGFGRSARFGFRNLTLCARPL